MAFDIDASVLGDAGFAAGLMSGSLRRQLVPVPVRVDGFGTVAFSIEAEPIGRSCLKILHPVLIVPHPDMILQDLRDGANRFPIDRVAITPIDVRHARYMRAAIQDPKVFLGAGWE